MPAPQPLGSMPTLSPAQKNTKLKSIVYKPLPKQQDTCLMSSWQPDRAPPYHSMIDKLEDFMQYIMQSGALVCEYYNAEIDDLMVFCHEQSSITHQIVPSILYMELAWFRGYPYTFPVILPQLEKKAPHPDDAPLPKCPKESQSCHAVGHRENCQVWWCYLLALLQYWKEADSPYPYGGLLRCDSKLMMYVYYQI